MSDRFEDVAEYVLAQLAVIPDAGVTKRLRLRAMVGALKGIYAMGAVGGTDTPEAQEALAVAVESGAMPSRSKDAATLARVRRLVEAWRGEDYTHQDDAVHSLIGRAVSKDPPDACPACASFLCEVWGTV